MCSHVPIAIKAAANQNSNPGMLGQIANEMMTPKSGAIEKYAPVLAVPSPLRATTNRVRLRP